MSCDFQHSSLGSGEGCPCCGLVFFRGSPALQREVESAARVRWMERVIAVGNLLDEYREAVESSTKWSSDYVLNGGDWVRRRWIKALDAEAEVRERVQKGLVDLV